MSKLRCDAIWNTFTAEQKEQIEDWLFGQNLGYKETLQRCKDQLGLSCSWACLQRIYQRLAEERAIDRAAHLFGVSDQLAATGGDADKLRPSVTKMLATRLLQKAVEDDNIRQVAVYGRLLMQAETRELIRDKNEILRETKEIRRETKDIQRDRFALSREKFEFNASEAALKALPMAEQIRKEDIERERARMEAMRQQIFRKELPHIIE